MNSISGFIFGTYASKILILLSHIVIYSVPACRGDCIVNPSHNVTVKEKELLQIIKPLQGLTFETKDIVDPAQYNYKVSICDKIKGQDPGIGAVQYATNETSSTSHSLGRYDNADIMGGTDWILLTYYDGDTYHTHCNKSGRVAKIMIICDPDVLSGKFEILEERRSSESSCYYLFELGSNVSCSKLPKSVKLPYGLSSGSVFCILFFTIISVYLTCGFLYKRIVIGAKGLEQIPNYSFWRDFGNLQADGCDYFCRCGPRQESQAYRGIDDHLKMDEERDDQLLNM